MPRFSNYWSVCSFFACLSLKSAHKSDFCSFLAADRPVIAHMLQLFTVFVLVFPFTGASAHFPPARALKVRINRVFALLVLDRPEFAHMLQLFTVFVLVFSIYWSVCSFFACLSLESAHKSGFCSFFMTVRPVIAHMLQFFTRRPKN